ncbi:MAG TPA: GAF domain-containing protein [Calditrichaeota bacterium]|nr:GAF domain-containing protein [Calditrichota bacterium]
MNEIDVYQEKTVEALKQENARLNSLLQITQSLSSTIDLDRLLSKITDIVRITLKADRCTVFLLDYERNELWSKIATGVKKEIRFPANRGIAGHVATSGEVLNIPDAYADSRFNPDIDQKTGYHTRNMLTMPMRNNQGEIIGVFQVLNKEKGPFTKDDEELLTAISGVAAASIENAQLYDELNKSFDSFIETLSSALDARDYITSGHSRRVTLYAVEIARLMRLPQDQINVIRYASLLHDIGKIGIPEIVLFKNKELTQDEYEIIKRHATLSKSILGKIHFQRHLRQIPAIAASHHEKIDGSGYPEGLKGDQIPLGGKIIAVCDVFDALTSRRQYRDRMELERVMDILENETASSFEPFVVYQFKNIPLNVLIGILEFGHNDDLNRDDLAFLRNYTLKDLLQVRRNQSDNENDRKVEEVFMRYYLRKYRL